MNERPFGETHRAQNPGTGQYRCGSTEAHRLVGAGSTPDGGTETAGRRDIERTRRTPERETDDVIADVELRDVRTDGSHDPRDLVTEHRGRRHEVMRGEQEVRVAEAGGSNVDEELTTQRRGDLDVLEVEAVAQCIQDKRFHGGREFATIRTDTSKISLVSVQYQEGIKWSYGICATSSRLARSNISGERLRASMSRSRHCRGRFKTWRKSWDFSCSTGCPAESD